MSADAFVYILRCADGTLYTGWTNDLNKRLAAHNAGRASRCTCARRPVTLAYFEQRTDKSDALRREAEIKTRTRAQKLALIDEIDAACRAQVDELNARQTQSGQSEKRKSISRKETQQ